MRGDLPRVEAGRDDGTTGVSLRPERRTAVGLIGTASGRDPPAKIEVMVRVGPGAA